jgi:hypothetical protein
LLPGGGSAVGCLLIQGNALTSGGELVWRVGLALHQSKSMLVFKLNLSSLSICKELHGSSQSLTKSGLDVPCCFMVILNLIVIQWPQSDGHFDILKFLAHFAINLCK